MAIQFEDIVYYIHMGYNVSMKNLQNLSLEELICFAERFPYKLSCILKNNDTYKHFDNKLLNKREKDCYSCSKKFEDYRHTIRYEIIGHNRLESICEHCHNNKKKEEELLRMYNI